jgi:hypothetical protein
MLLHNVVTVNAHAKTEYNKSVIPGNFREGGECGNTGVMNLEEGSSVLFCSLEPVPFYTGYI